MVTADKGLAKVTKIRHETVPGKGMEMGQYGDWKEYDFPDELGLRNLAFPFEGSRGEVLGTAFSIQDKWRVLVQFDGENWQTLWRAENEDVIMGWPGGGESLWLLRGEYQVTPFAPFTSQKRRLISVLSRVEGNQEVSIEWKGHLSGNIRDIEIESNGVFWLAKRGLARNAPPTWRTPLAAGINRQVYSVQQDKQGRLWFSSIDALVLLNSGQWSEYPLPKGKQVTGKHFFCSLTDGRIAVVTRDDSLLAFSPENPDKGFTSIQHPSGRKVHSIAPRKDGSAWVITVDAVSWRKRVELFDGNRFETIVDDLFFIRKCHDFHETANGDLWLVGEDGVGLYRNGEYRKIEPSGDYANDFSMCVAEMEDGKIWVGGVNKILEFDGETWRILKTGFANVHQFYKRRDGSVWVVSQTGIYRYLEGSWISNGYEDGLPTDRVYSLFEDRQGRFWACTSSGLSLYYPEADPDPPQTYLSPEENSTEIAPGGKAQFTYSGVDKWKYTESDRLVYSHRIDEGEWSPFTLDTVASVTGLSAGPHRFDVRAIDRNWNISKTTSWEFRVLLPWYKEPGYLMTITIGMILILVFAGYAANRHVKLRRSYNTLRRTQNQLIQSEKMASLGQLVAGVAHEINNPINFIKSNIQPLKDYLSGYKKYVHTIHDEKEGLSDTLRVKAEAVHEEKDLEFADKDSEKLIAAFEEGSNRISKIVSDLRQYIRMDVSYYSPHDIHEALESPLLVLINQFQDRVTVHKEYGGIPKVQCSPGQINQVFMNILKNATEFIEDNGNVWITTTQEAENVIVTIRDDGKGIPLQNLSKVFDPFFTTKPVGSGTGLGLSLSYGIIEQHGGTITVESEEGKGTTFTVTLPI